MRYRSQVHLSSVVAARREEQQFRQHKEQERERVSEMLHEQKPEVVGELYHFLVITQCRTDCSSQYTVLNGNV